MSLSMNIAVNNIKDKKGYIDKNELMFYLICLRDNTPDDELNQLLNKIILDI